MTNAPSNGTRMSQRCSIHVKPSFVETADQQGALASAAGNIEDCKLDV